MFRSLSVLVFYSSLALCTAKIESPLEYQAAFLEPRSPSYGGYALVADPCLVNLADCEKADKCCPANMACQRVDGFRAGYACCSSTSNCSPDVKAAPACADDSWSLWQSNSGYLCCLANQIGIKSTKVVGECVSGDVGVAMIQSATLVTAGTGPTQQPSTVVVPSASPTRPAEGSGSSSGSGTGSGAGSATSSVAGPRQSNGSVSQLRIEGLLVISTGLAVTAALV